ncbi:DUF4386 domain-containing protein [Flagellimonas nanhaiensis]|nr:DUF4386 domain-containing protein [Allomuricauda nanhaiensis]
MSEISIQKAAQIAGVSIVLMTLAAVAATDLTIGPLIVSGNATATEENIRASAMTFRLGVLSWIIILVCDVFAAWGLYEFLKPVNKGLSLISAWLRLVYAAILGASMLNLAHILVLINNENYVSALGTQVLFFMDSFESLWSLGLLVFGLHIFLVGYLTWKSGYVPKILGIWLIIGFFGYMITHLSGLLLPQFSNFNKIMGWIFIIPMLGEVALGLWLIIKGRKIVLQSKNTRT